jgi:RNA polymerase sigma-70 factor (ECF subfamily)
MDDLDYEQVVALHHESLYRFAFSLAGNPDAAAELTQEGYVRLLTRGGQLRDKSRIKAWLFTTVYRIFLGWKRHENRFPHVEIVAAEHELPVFSPSMANTIDGEAVMASLLELDEQFRAPLVLYYLQSLTYREIAGVLDLPIGTVMSRLSRGKSLLRARLASQNTQSKPALRAAPGHQRFS